jgi:hypothetical protein
MKNCLKKVILLCLLFFPLTSVAEGFTAGTLVLTSIGYVPIEDIQVNDEVICLDACGQLTTGCFCCSKGNFNLFSNIL